MKEASVPGEKAPNPVSKNSNMMNPTLSSTVHTHSRLVQAAFWQAQQMSEKTLEETEAPMVEERGIKHTNPFKALFGYLEDSFHFNWQFKPT